MLQTKFVYETEDFTNEYLINDCYQYPFYNATLGNAISSEFQDGYITTRKRVSKTFALYTLSFAGMKEEEKLKIQELENLVGQSDIFYWYPSYPIEPRDYDDQGIVLDPIPLREVRLTTPIQYELFAPKLYNLTMNLQEAI